MRKLALLAMVCFAIQAQAVSDFSLKDMNSPDGATFNSADHPNTVYLIEAWFYNCPYCHENAPNIHDLAGKYENEPRVQVLDVGVDRSDSYYTQWINKWDPHYPVLKDDRRRLINELGVSGYPSTFVLDADLNIVYRSAGTLSSSSVRRIQNAIDEAVKDSNGNDVVHPIKPTPWED